MVRMLKILINGYEKNVVIRNADTLLHTLREQCGLTGVKQGCENGDCGACTVLIDGNPQHSCLVLACETEGHSVTTIEGLRNTPMQRAFVDHWAIQCGYCTPGIVLNGHALTQLHPDADDRMIEDWLQSNLCRCTGYEEIKEAVKSVLAGNVGEHAADGQKG